MSFQLIRRAAIELASSDLSKDTTDTTTPTTESNQGENQGSAWLLALLILCAFVLGLVMFVVSLIIIHMSKCVYIDIFSDKYHYRLSTLMEMSWLLLLLLKTRIQIYT